MRTDPLSPSERTIRARLAAHSKHALYDPVEGTAKARQAFRDRFERDVDPEGVLSPEERARRAEHARKAFYLRLSMQGVKARRKGASDAIP